MTFRFTICDMLWLMVVGMGVGCSARPTNIVKQLAAADSVSIEGTIEGKPFQCDLSPDTKQALVAWLRNATYDSNPRKYVVMSTLKLSPRTDPDEWLVMSIRGDEVGLRVNADSYWRGLKRAEFKRLVMECQPTQ